MDDKIQDIIYQYLGKKIKDFRVSLGITQEQLGISIGLSRASVVNIEKGRQHASLHLLYQIAQCLKTDVHSIIPKESSLFLDVLIDDEDMRGVSQQSLMKLNTFIQKHQNLDNHE